MRSRCDVLRGAQKARRRRGLVFPAPSLAVWWTRSATSRPRWSSDRAREGTRAGLTGWTWHDFRRSFATALGEAGIPEAVADAVLNHRQAATRGGVLGVYQRASRWPEQMRAMELWGRLLSAALGQSDASVDGEALDAVAD